MLWSPCCGEQARTCESGPDQPERPDRTTRRSDELMAQLVQGSCSFQAHHIIAELWARATLVVRSRGTAVQALALSALKQHLITETRTLKYFVDHRSCVWASALRVQSPKLPVFRHQRCARRAEFSTVSSHVYMPADRFAPASFHYRKYARDERVCKAPTRCL
jgi:hypothetical protein